MKITILNPLIRNLLEREDYQKLLEKLDAQGYRVIDLYDDLKKVKKIVLQKYADWLSKTSKFPVIDSRCPRIRKLLIYEFPHLMDFWAPILPILITGAELKIEELKSRNIEVSGYLVSPCKEFTRWFFSKEDIIIVTWQEFKNLISFYPPQRLLTQTPVPKGFFNDLEVKVYGETGENECRKLLSRIPADAQLLELLWCEGGCHRGDGLV